MLCSVGQVIIIVQIKSKDYVREMLATPVILKEDNIYHGINFVNLKKWVCEENRRIIIAVEGSLGSIAILTQILSFLFLLM